MGKLHFYVNTVTNLELSRVLGANKYPVKSKVSDIPQAVLSLYLYIKAKVDPRTSRSADPSFFLLVDLP